MDYDEWTPLGRGDPLKNDPTFDYVPPVLDRVQYWLDTHTTEPASKRDILVLGVTAKKTSPKIPEHFLKFVDGPKFNRNQDPFRNDFTGSTGAEPPKIIRTNNFRIGSMDFRNQNRIQSLPASYYPSPFYSQKSKPYTMMMPPPINQKPINELSQNSYGNLLKEKIIFPESQHFSTQTEEGPTLQETQFYNHPPKTFSQGHPPLRSTHSHVSPPPLKPKVMITQENMQSIFTQSSQIPNQRFETTTPSVSFEKSNLIYQSTQTLSGGWIGSSRPTSSAPSVELNQITWKTPDRYEVDHHESASANHDVVIGQNANIIVDGDNNNEEVVIGHKDLSFQEGNSQNNDEKVLEGPSATTSIKPSTESSIGSTEPKMHIVVANSPSKFELEANKEPVSIVMPVNYVETKPNTTESTPLTSSTRNSPIPTENSKMDNLTDNPEIPSFQEFVSSPESSSPDFMSVERPLQMQKPQPFRSSISSPMMPPFMENTQTAYPIILSNRNPPTHQPARHPGFHIFGESMSQHMALQHPRPIMMPQPGFRPPLSMNMGQIPPSMTHMKMPPRQSVMRPPMSAEQAYQQHQLHQKNQQYHQNQQHQLFPATFTSSPPGSSSTLQVTRGSTQGHRYSPITDPMLLTTMQSTIFPPTTRRPVTITGEGFLDYTRNQSPLVHLLNSEESQKVESGFSTDFVSTPSSLQTTTVPTLTTDPIFSHYKQPAKPIRGPMYLIIQGHSKVKTYKPTVNKYGVPVENNEILDNTTERPQSKLEKLVNENEKANAAIREKDLSARRKLEERKENRGGPISLLSLVENGFSAFTVSPPQASEEERQTNSITTLEINGN